MCLNNYPLNEDDEPKFTCQTGNASKLTLTPSWDTHTIISLLVGVVGVFVPFCVYVLNPLTFKCQ